MYLYIQSTLVLSSIAIGLDKDCTQRRVAGKTWKELMNAGLLLVSLLIVGLPSAALGLEMSGALGRLSVSFLPAPCSTLLTGPGLGRFACAAAGCQLLHAACLIARRAVQLPKTYTMRAPNNRAPNNHLPQTSTTKGAATMRQAQHELMHVVITLGMQPGKG